MTRIITTIMASPPSSPASTAGPNKRLAITAASPRKPGLRVYVVVCMRQHLPFFICYLAALADKGTHRSRARPVGARAGTRLAAVSGHPGAPVPSLGLATVYGIVQ